MSSELITHFVDGSDVELQVWVDARLIEMSVRDERTLGKYRLRFARCVRMDISYADDEEDFSALNDLTEGVHEEESGQPGVRHFTIGFADGSIMEIACRDFSMDPIEE